MMISMAGRLPWSMVKVILMVDPADVHTEPAVVDTFTSDIVGRASNFDSSDDRTPDEPPYVPFISSVFYNTALKYIWSVI